jgi:anti-sigma B factor antagonist
MTPPAHQLDIDERRDQGGRLVLVLSGDIDLQTAPRLTTRIVAAAGRDETVVLDLSAVRFVDSPGLGSLIHCHLRLAESDAHLVLRSPRAHVRELFDLVQLCSLLTIEDSA